MEKNKIKLLYIINGLPSGGKERQFIELIKSINKDLFDYRLITLKNIIEVSGSEQFQEQIIIVPRKNNFILTLYIISRELYRYKPDIIHAWDHVSVIFSILYASIFNIKFIDGSIRGSFNWERRNQILKATIPFTNVLIANSRAGLSSINKQTTNKFRVIYNGFDFNRNKNINSAPILLKSQLNIKTRFVIGMVANIRQAKDYKTYIKSAIKILEERDDVTFVSVGKWYESKSILNIIPKKFLEKILFLGEKKNVEEIIQLFDIGCLICNTLTDGEGLSNSIMEYMSLGKPVIATDSGGNKELIIDQQTGFIIPPFDENNLVSKILYLLNNETIRYNMGQEGKKRIIHDFNIKRMVEQYETLYCELTQKC